MKKNYKILFILVFFISQTVQGQEKEAALAKIHYQFVHVNDTSQRDKYHQDEMVLYLGRHSSLYSSYSNKRVEEQVKEQMEDSTFDGNLIIKGSGSATRESYYSIPVKLVLQQVYALSGDHYLVEEEFPKLDWEIMEETKEIGGYSCQKAGVHFKGRDYTVWFTSEIPFQSGPWKLSGLPGLIMEAVDSRNEVSFRYAGFDKIDSHDFFVEIPENTIKTDKKTLIKQIEAYKKNPSAYIKARAVGRGSSASSPMNNLDPSKIKNIRIENSGVQKSPVTNNPIEIEEN